MRNNKNLFKQILTSATSIRIRKTTVTINKNDHLFLHSTDCQQFSLFNRRLNIKHSLIVSTCDSCELINETSFFGRF